MKRKKLILPILLILILTVFLAGCSVFENIYETLCCIPGLFSLPLAAVCIKLISK